MMMALEEDEKWCGPCVVAELCGEVLIAPSTPVVAEGGG